MGPLDVERVHQPEDVGGHLLHRVFHDGAVALPCAAVVVNDDPVALRKRSNLGLPVRAFPAQPGDEEDGVSLSDALVIEVDLSGLDLRHR